MTTVVVDIKNKKAYSDSRVTWKSAQTGEINYKETKDKIIKNLNKNSLCVLVGNVAIYQRKLEGTGFRKSFKNVNSIYGEGSTCEIIVLQKGSNLITVLSGKIVDYKVKWKYQRFGGSYGYAGSGVVTKEAQKVIRYIDNGVKIPYEKIIKAASITDKHTDDAIRMEVL